MTGKKTPPKKLSKADEVKAIKEQNEAADAELEKESGLPASFEVTNKAGKKFKVSREYYLKYEGELEIVD